METVSCPSSMLEISSSSSVESYPTNKVDGPKTSSIIDASKRKFSRSRPQQCWSCICIRFKSFSTCSQDNLYTIATRDSVQSCFICILDTLMQHWTGGNFLHIFGISCYKPLPHSPPGWKTIPGFVQNCPTPRVAEPVSPSANVFVLSGSISESTNNGLTLLISANTGIGSGLLAARSNNALPPI